MRALFSSVYATHWSTLSVVIFSVVFVVIVGWVFSSRQRKVYEQAEKLPLEED